MGKLGSPPAPFASTEATSYEYWLHASNGPLSVKVVSLVIPIRLKSEVETAPPGERTSRLRKIAYEPAPGTAAHLSVEEATSTTRVGNGANGGGVIRTGPASTLSRSTPKRPGMSFTALTRISTVDCPPTGKPSKVVAVVVGNEQVPGPKNFTQ